MTTKTTLDQSIALWVPQRSPAVQQRAGNDFGCRQGQRQCSSGLGMILGAAAGRERLWVQTVQTLGADLRAAAGRERLWVQTMVHALTLPSHCVGTTRIYYSGDRRIQ